MRREFVHRAVELKITAYGMFDAAEAPMGPHCWWWGPGFFFGPPWNMLFGLLFWVFVLYAVGRVVTSSGRASADDRRQPLDILKERYARGEIDHDEFERRRHSLEA